MKSIIPMESAEQINLFRWATLQSGKHPELELLMHVPNGGYALTKASAGRMRAEGVKKGFPDLFLPVARGNYHGMIIEMKRTKGGHLSVDQKWWLERLIAQGYRAIVCRGWKAAADEITKYLSDISD